MTATWTPDAPPFGTWDVQRGQDVVRITEDGRRRVIEQAGPIVRIIERFRTTWDIDAPASGAWTIT